MNTIKHICLTFIQLAKQVGALPKSIKNAVNQRQQQAVLDKREAERLDRICNPLKYRGK
ncbi:MAG TPA: hypothetical protein VHG89_10635 [Verrucomicrobiae bacterium]|nr:hypothetical protein [Verrucomicrobiae bacterium]